MEQEAFRQLQIRCRSLYNRGTRRGIPYDCATELDNFRFTDVALTREPIELELDFSTHITANGGTKIIRFYGYKRKDENIRYIILDDTGRFYDSGLASPGTPILGPLSGAVDFSAITLYNRVYFTIHDRKTGIPGGFMYVYDPDLGTTARAAAGYAPLKPYDFQPIAWYSADTIAGVPDLGKVTYWYDLTGNGYHLYQTNNTYKPIWVANGVNSLPAVKFDGTDDVLTAAQNYPAFVAADAKGTIFVVYQALTGGGAAGFLFTDNQSGHGICATSTGPNLQARAYDGTLDTAVKVHTLDAWHIGCRVYDGTNVHIMMDDQDDLGRVSTASGTQTMLDFPVLCGSGFKGYIAELIIFNSALSEENRRRVTKYLKDKYKLSESTSDPVASLSLAQSATAGNVEPGQHVMAMSYVTNTGFISRPGAHATVTMSARMSIDVSNIPIGPPWVVKRWFWMSKVLRNWDGNVFAPELFFVKELSDNTTTSLTGTAGISSYDTQLVMSADPYSNLMERVPAGVGLCDFDGNLVSVGEYDLPSLARVSNPGQPEGFNALDGFVQTGPDGGGLRNAESLYGNLYLFKSFRTYGVQRSELAPAYWKLSILDIGRGAECFSIATVLDSISATLQLGLVIANPAGLFLFNGSYSEALDFPISQLWFDDATQSSDFTQTMACVDPITKQGFIHVGARHTYLFDYKLGISADTIRISRWSLGEPGDSITICCAFRNNMLMPSLIFSKNTGLKELRRITFNGLFQSRERLSSLDPIPWRYRSAPLSGSDKSIRCHLNGLVIVGTLGDGIGGPGSAVIELHDDITGNIENNLQRLNQFGGPENSMTHFTHADFTFETLAILLAQDNTNPSSIQIEKINLFLTPEADMVPL